MAGPERIPVFAFMALVTLALVAMMFAEATSDLSAGVVVHAIAAAFGLQYLSSAWVELWPEPPVGGAQAPPEAE